MIRYSVLETSSLLHAIIKPIIHACAMHTSICCGPALRSGWLLPEVAASIQVLARAFECAERELEKSGVCFGIPLK
jgi:hypothetical protein